jgi:hypothetical protein
MIHHKSIPTKHRIAWGLTAQSRHDLTGEDGKSRRAGLGWRWRGEVEGERRKAVRCARLGGASTLCSQDFTANLFCNVEFWMSKTK